IQNMGKRSDTDKAIRNLMNWASRPEWSDEQASVFNAHLAPICDRVGISQEELVQELEEHGYGGMLFGMMFEDFISRRLPPDDRNIIDDYLERRGWRENIPGRRYLQNLRDSVLSLYEVIDVSPGHHCDLRDMVRDGETIRVHEHMGTQNLVKWDRIAARVLNTNGKYIFSGGILPFPREASQSLLRVLSDSKKQFKKAFSRAVGKEAIARISSDNLDEQFLQDACPAFTSIWVVHALERLHEPLPEIINRDGEALVFTETRFPFLAEQLEEIAHRLDDAPDWEQVNPDEPTWIWLPEPGAVTDKPQGGIAVDTLRDGQHSISGTLELKPGVLMLTTNSMERAQRGQDVLETLLHGLVGPALSKLQTPEQLMAENERNQQGGGSQESTDPIDPEIEAEILQNSMDQHYRQCLDEPIPALDNKTPRQCTRSKKGREKVMEWLKHLENNELHRAARQGHAPYDSRWMWDELKLAKYRNSQ
ncbi:MAG: hypothetical protein WBO57_03980, partial [Gammaproteobacteria bacterium]